MTQRVQKIISPEIRENIKQDIRQLYFNGDKTQKELALKHEVPATSMRQIVIEVLKDMEAENKLKKELDAKINNSEEEIAKYGIPNEYKLIK